MVYVGTAGYSYKDWVGPFYPKDTKDNLMLDYYALHFNFVEINSTFYHMPSIRLLTGVNHKTPDSFRLAVKIFGGFTHERNMGKIEAEQFKYALGPITESGKLICLLAQFPYSFHCTIGNVKYLKQLSEMFKGIEINVEFRNQEWIKEKVFNMLRDYGLGFVCVDEPAIKGLANNVAVTTSKIAYMRLHGRNAEKWYAGKGSERYDYLYTQEELASFIPQINYFADNAPFTVVSLNNHPVGKAVLNAQALISML